MPCPWSGIYKTHGSQVSCYDMVSGYKCQCPPLLWVHDLKCVWPPAQKAQSFSPGCVHAPHSIPLMTQAGASFGDAGGQGQAGVAPLLGARCVLPSSSHTPAPPGHMEPGATTQPC